MLLQRLPDGSLKNMHVAHYPELVLMSCSAPSSTTNPLTTITFKPPKASGQEARSIDLPLEPDTDSLEEVHVNMHESPTKAFDMGEPYNSFLSDCLGYQVVLAYLGPNLRPVLMSTPTKPSSAANSSASSGGWLSSLSKLPSSVTGLITGQQREEEDKITFADCAPYLVVSDKSMEDVNPRLPEGQEMDMTKFRPSIVVSGADEPWEEDFWAEMEISKGADVARLRCAHNCARCVSINIGKSLVYH